MKSRRALVVVLGIAALVGWGTSAAAHTALVSSSPAPGAAVESPAVVSLTFSEPLLAIGAGIFVLDAEGVEHAAGAAYFPEPATIQVDVLPLAPGAYTAAWRVVADDGHPIEGRLPFTVVAAPSPTPSATGQSATPSSTRASSPSPTVSAATVSGATVSAGTVPATDAAQPQGQVWVTIAATLAAIALIAVAVFFSRPKDAATGSRGRSNR